MDAVGAHWNELPSRERRILLMRFYGNLTQAEIGERLGISQMHVSRLQATALRYLRECLFGGESDEDSATARPSGASLTEARETGMKTGVSLALIAVGAILAFAVTGHPGWLDVQAAGWVLMLVGLAGMFIPRRGFGWLRRSGGAQARPPPCGGGQPRGGQQCGGQQRHRAARPARWCSPRNRRRQYRLAPSWRPSPRSFPGGH